jgi:GTPase SAR1 family protein
LPVPERGIELILVDQPGTEQYRSMVWLHSRDADVVAVVFSLFSKSTLDDITGWIF